MPEVRLPAPVLANRSLDVDHDHRPGAFGFYIHGDPLVMRGLIYRCPCGCDALHALPFHPLSADDLKHGRAGWTWDGNEAAPTLSPSIVSHDETGPERPVHWHGFLRSGFWVQA